MNSIAKDLRRNPSDAFIAAVRKKYPVEPEVDHVLTRKMTHRHKSGYTAISLDTLRTGLEALIRSEVGSHFVLDNLRWLPGGFSKIQVAFDLEWEGATGTAPAKTALVLRMEPAEAIVATSRRREFEILKLVSAVVPTAPVYWLDHDGKYLPYPALVYGFAPGVSMPSGGAQEIKGGRTVFGPGLRAALANQFVAHLAAIHTIPPPKIAALKYFQAGEPGSNESVIRQVNWWRRVWEEDRPEEVPLVDVAARWLVENAPPLDHPCVVHGDFRVGNFLFTETNARITAWLDWELAVIGDRHQDITWAAGPLITRLAEDDRTELAGGLIPIEEFYRRYEEASGLVVDAERLRYFRVFNDFQAMVHMLATAWRIASLGKTDKDVAVAWISMIGNVAAACLRDSLAKVL
jgi:aminoglycoside phosphotransferase (APT) family kinase protein